MNRFFYLTNSCHLWYYRKVLFGILKSCLFYDTELLTYAKSISWHHKIMPIFFLYDKNSYWYHRYYPRTISGYAGNAAVTKLSLPEASKEEEIKNNDNINVTQETTNARRKKELQLRNLLLTILCSEKYLLGGLNHFYLRESSPLILMQLLFHHENMPI